MRKDPDDRYQSAREMDEDIAAFKRDPSISFDYKYLGDTDDNEFKRSLMKAQSKKKTGKGQNDRTSRSRRSTSDSYMRDLDTGSALPPKEKKPISVIPILGGITAAFVLVAGIFIAVMVYLNNPFQPVPNVTMPNLIGLSYEELKRDSNYTFVFEVEASENSYNYANGVIYDQNPKVGRTVKEGAKVRVKVSLGPLEVTMPSLVGKTAEEAYEALGDLKLEYHVTEVFSSIYEPGVVVSTNPSWGSTVRGNQEVEMQVSMGPDAKPLPVPELTGLSLDNARKLASEMGFVIGDVSYVYSEQPFNTVVAQDPTSESSMVEGGLININVSYGTSQVMTLTINVPLPQTITELTEMSCMVDGEIVKLEKLYPNEVESGYWRQSFEGQTVMNVIVLLDGKVYQTYSLDFTTGETKLTENNASDFS